MRRVEISWTETGALLIVVDDAMAMRIEGPVTVISTAEIGATIPLEKDRCSPHGCEHPRRADVSTMGGGSPSEMCLDCRCILPKEESP